MTAKSLDTQNMRRGGGGQSTIPIQVKLSCLKLIKTVLTLIYSQLFCFLVSHNKYSDIYFDKKTALNSFYIGFIQNCNINACHQSKSPIKMNRN